MYEESEAQRRRLINCIIFKTLHFGAQPCKILILMRAPLLPFENVIAIICTPTIRRVTIAASLYENKNHQPDLLSSFQIKFIWPWNICTGRTFFPGCASCVSQGCLLPHAEAPPLHWAPPPRWAPPLHSGIPCPACLFHPSPSFPLLATCFLPEGSLHVSLAVSLVPET